MRGGRGLLSSLQLKQPPSADLLGVPLELSSALSSPARCSAGTWNPVAPFSVEQTWVLWLRGGTPGACGGTRRGSGRSRATWVLVEDALLCRAPRASGQRQRSGCAVIPALFLALHSQACSSLPLAFPWGKAGGAQVSGKIQRDEASLVCSAAVLRWVGMIC